MKKFLLLPLALLAAALAGCGGSSLAIKPDAISQVKTIALIKAPPPEYRMINLGSPIPLLTLTVDTLDGTTHSIEGAVSKANFAFNDRLTDELAAQLEKSGFKVILIDAQHDNKALLENYANIDSHGADAILDVVVKDAGFATQHYMFSPEWRPESNTSVAMYSTKSNEVVYQETLMYGYHNPLMTATDLDAPAEYMFKSKEDVFANGDKTVIAGLEEAVKSTASQIAARLRN